MSQRWRLLGPKVVMRWSNWEEERSRQKNHLTQNSDERAGEMGLTWGEALAIAQVTQFRTGLSGDVLIAALCPSRDEVVESMRVSYLCWDDYCSQSSLQTSLMKHDTLPFPVWTQSGWGSLCARYPRLEQGWRGSQGCDLSDICIPPRDCSSAPIRLWFQIHQNKTLSISAVTGYTTQKSIGKLDTRIWF